MDPRDFHKLASDLVKNNASANLRTAIGRAYYSVYNVGLEILKGMGFSVRSGPEAHGRIRMQFACCGIAIIEEAASKMGDLHSNRIQADYFLKNKTVENQKTVEAIIKNAESVIIAFDSCNSEPIRTKVTKAIQAYRRNVLRCN